MIATAADEPHRPQWLSKRYNVTLAPKVPGPRGQLSRQRLFTALTFALASDSLLISIERIDLQETGQMVFVVSGPMEDYIGYDLMIDSLVNAGMIRKNGPTTKK